MSYSDDWHETEPKNVNLKVHRYKGKVKVNITFEVNETRDFDKGEIRARLERTAPWMLEHLYSWADFDHSYSINLFIDALHNLGKGLKRWNNHVNADKCYKRCMAAAAMLKKAYNYHAWEDASYKNHMKRTAHRWGKFRKGLSQMHSDHLYDNAMGMPREEYETKMFHVIHKRQKREEEHMRQEAWAFIHKHIESWWD